MKTCKLCLILPMPYRTGFQQFLRRPDHKQDFVSQWQADFNSLPDDLWDDEETKAELHQRVNVRESVNHGAQVSTQISHCKSFIYPLITFMRCEDKEGNGLNTNLPTFKSSGSSALWVQSENPVVHASQRRCQGQGSKIIPAPINFVHSYPLCQVM